MTGEVQPVCARCEHTPLEHSAGPCHQRSAAGVGCDCGGWAAAVTLGRQALIQKIRDRVDLQAEAQRRADTDPEDEVAADAGYAETRLTHCPQATGGSRVIAAEASRPTFKVSVWQLVEGGRTRLGRLDTTGDTVPIGRLRRGSCVGLVLTNDGARGLRSLTIQLTTGE